ncbi:MAG TPA: Fe-S cluster assembly protein HesB [Blastocatellia bacterium]|nr:Fe-S cluster assembly protein HesB [Blastocatellia bacterium]
MEIRIPVSPQFGFKRTVLSHGWCELPPFQLDKSSWTLTRVLDLGLARAVTVTITGSDGQITVRTPAKLSSRGQAKVVRDVSHILRLDDDMTCFYTSVSANREFAWVAEEGAGRLLRSPTVFEDLVKMMCTTNCSWALTERMVNGMVYYLGKPASDGRRAFPDAEAMARMPESFYRKELSAGYRAPYLKELASRVASGRIDVEGWLGSEAPDQELKREMKQIKGVGDYVAENMLKLVGRYHGLALDSWIRGKFAKTRNKGRVASDKKIERFYAEFGDWKGLALWCDVTRDWLVEGKVTWSE